MNDPQEQVDLSFGLGDPELLRELEEYSGTVALKSMSFQALLLAAEAAFVVVLAMVLSSHRLSEQDLSAPAPPAGDVSVADLPPATATLEADAYVTHDRKLVADSSRLLVEKRTSGEPALALMRFRIEGLAGRKVASASLRLVEAERNDVAAASFRVSLVKGTWDEDNPPSLQSRLVEGQMLGAYGGSPVKAGEEVVVELDSSVFTADGLYDLGLSGLTEQKFHWFISREGGRPPELVLKLDDGTTPKTAAAKDTPASPPAKPPAPAAVPSASAVFAAVADAYITRDRSLVADSNTLHIDSGSAESPVTALLRFRVAGLAGRRIKAVHLHLVETVDGSTVAAGFRVSLTTGAWNEKSVWRMTSMPGEAKVLGTHDGSPVKPGEDVVVALDRTAFAGDGLYDLGLAALADRQKHKFMSRETERPPKLVFTFEE